MHNRRRIFIASCVALVANAMQFSICTDIRGDMSDYFQLTLAMVGLAVGYGAVGQVLAQLLGGAFLDEIGAGTALWLACGAQVIGLTTIISAHSFATLAAGWTFMVIAGGLIEASINPLVATEYPDQKTHMLNVLHAWWPGGLIIGGLSAYGFSALLKATGAPPHIIAISWKIKMAFVYLPVLLYAALIFRQKFPKTERAQAGVSLEAMFREALRPMFLVLIFCMFLTASLELAPNQWVGVFIGDILGGKEASQQFRGVLVLVYTSGLMFVLRFFAGPLAKKITPLGILIGSSVLSGLGLLALSYSHSVAMVFAAATVFGVGVTYFWPTMLGVTSERFPKGGAFLLAIIGAAGGLFVSYASGPGMGKLHDHYTLAALPAVISQQIVVKGRVDEEKLNALPDAQKKTARQAVDDARKSAASITFRWVALPAAALIVIFGAMFLRDHRRGGYKQEILTPPSG